MLLETLSCNQIIDEKYETRNGAEAARKQAQHVRK